MKKLKTFPVFFLTALLLMQSVQAGISFFQYTQLESHYKFHHEKSGENFYSFLFQHYGDESAQHSSQDSSHQNLPHKANLSLGIDYFQQPDYFFTFFKLTIFQKPILFYRERAYDFFRSVPIQPPKAV